MEVKKEFLTELGKTDYDKEDLEIMLENLIDMQQEIEEKVGQNLIELRQILSDDEAEKLFEYMAKRTVHNRKRR